MKYQSGLGHRVSFAALIPLLLALSACQPAAPAAPTAILEPTATLIPYSSPDWFQHAVLYEIFVRSFYDSDGNRVGDLNGITEKLDYIRELGVDAIWLMPIYPSPSVHGYDVIDLLAVNPDYGSLEKLNNLVQAAHARGLRVILDFVPSHLSNQNPIFKDAYGKLDSKYADWFVFTNDAHTQYAGFADSREMPRFNHYNPEVVKYLTGAALFWLGHGVDGFRIDNVTFPPAEFFESLRQSIKIQYPDALLLGEAWVTNARNLSGYFPQEFDALFDLPLYDVVEGNPNFPGDGVLNGRSSTSLLVSTFADEEKYDPPAALSVHFFSNHDTDRIASETKGDPLRERLAASLLAALPGPALFYYGEEIGMPGRKGTAPYWDSYRREPMDWYAAEQGSG